MRKKQVTILYWASTAAFLLSSSTAVILLWIDSLYIPGLLFWGGLLLGILLYVTALHVIPGKWKQEKKQKPGVIRFFSNLPAKISDGLFLPLLGLTIYFAVDYNSDQNIAAVILFLLIMSVYAHFLLNGKVYSYIFQKKQYAVKGA